MLSSLTSFATESEAIAAAKKQAIETAEDFGESSEGAVLLESGDTLEFTASPDASVTEKTISGWITLGNRNCSAKVAEIAI